MSERTEEYQPPPPPTGQHLSTERAFIVAFQQLARFDPYGFSIVPGVLGRNELAEAARRVLGRSLEDTTVSREHIRLTPTKGGHIDLECMSSRGIRLNGWPVEAGTRAKLLGGEVLRLGGSVLVYEPAFVAQRQEDFRADADIVTPDGPIVGPYGLRALRRELARLPQAKPRVVLVHGETGTGKERTAHRVSELLGAKGVVPANIAAYPPNLIGAALFGTRKGDFTGAVDSDGLAGEAAKKSGALFLDEVGDLPPEGQVLLLRFLDRKGEIQAVGAGAPSSRRSAADVPIILATHRNVDELVGQGKLRQDFVARIQSRVELPALRVRSYDALPILLQIWRSRPEAAPVETDRISADAVETLMLAWHQENVRGLDQLAFEARKASQKRLFFDVDMVKRTVKNGGDRWWRAALCPSAVAAAFQHAPSSKRGGRDQAGQVAAVSWLNERAVGQPISEGTFKRFDSGT
jgi:hypothetical protein